MNIREIRSTDYIHLKDFLYHAVYQPPGQPPLPFEIIFQPDLFIYIDGFDTDRNRGDCGVVAESDGKIIGIAWTRIDPAYGHIDNETPELAISILPKYRGKGVGGMMLIRLFELLHGRGFRYTSLSVQKANPASRLYQRMGYEIVRENDDDYIMRKTL